MAKNVFDFLHIKRRTEGSSNELSFDVLDAASKGMDDSQKRKLRARGFTVGAGSESAHGAGAGSGSETGRAQGRGAHSAGKSPTRKSTSNARPTATLSSAAEVQRRKKERRAHSIRMQVVGALVIIVVLCGAAFLGYIQYQAKADFTTRINALVAQFIQIDPGIVKVDELVDDPLNIGEQQQRADALKTIPPLSSQLVSVRTEAEGLMQEVSGSDAQQTLNEVVAAADARLDLLAAAADLFELAAEVGDYSSTADKAWTRVLNADQLAREAAQLANAADTEQKTLASRDKTQQAIEQLDEALIAFQDLQEAKQKFDFSAQLAYLDARRQALEYALNTTDALLAGDRTAAQTANDKTNQAEQDAAQMAADLPANASAVIVQHYNTQLQQLESAYFGARDEVTLADSHLRAKL